MLPSSVFLVYVFSFDIAKGGSQFFLRYLSSIYSRYDVEDRVSFSSWVIWVLGSDTMPNTVKFMPLKTVFYRAQSSAALRLDCIGILTGIFKGHESLMLNSPFNCKGEKNGETCETLHSKCCHNFKRKLRNPRISSFTSTVLIRNWWLNISLFRF